MGKQITSRQRRIYRKLIEIHTIEILDHRTSYYRTAHLERVIRWLRRRIFE